LRDALQPVTDAVIHVYHAAGNVNVIDTHKHKGDFKEP